MSRLFGWDLPPGVTSRMIDEAYGVEGPCDICGRALEDCICPECHKCSGVGDPDCYTSHGLQRNEAQIIGRGLMIEAMEREEDRYAEEFERWMKREVDE